MESVSKKIGIIPTGSFKFYEAYFSQFGEVKSVFYFDLSLDLLVLPGGADVDSRRYGEIPDIKCGKPNKRLEYFDTRILPQYLENKTPIFGICRGMQTLAVTFGMKLCQHYPHKNDINPNDYILYNKKWIPINSLHHQHVLPTSPDFNFYKSYYTQTAEAMEHKTLPIKAVQWHPEFIYDNASSHLIKQLLCLDVLKV